MFEAFVQSLVVLPDTLKAAIALGVLYLVRLALAGRVPDQFLTEVSAVITTALVSVIELALGLIPLSFEAVAAAVLNLIAVLLGGVVVVNGYRLLKSAVIQRGIKF